MEEQAGTVATSCIPFLASEHGRLRQEQRRISTVDLQAAIKHGTRTRTFCLTGPNTGQPRWKFEYRGTTYITDDSCTQQITCWSEGLSFNPVEITAEMQERMEKHRRFLRAHPENISEHTVCVIDQSGSMKESDIPGARNRSTAVFSAILLDFFLESFVNGQGDSDDVLTIMDMRDKASVLLYKEPLDAMTWNKIVAMVTGVTPRGQGYFIPAFRALHRLLLKDIGSGQDHNVHAIFLTDGSPSDHMELRGLYGGIAQEVVLGRVTGLVRLIAQTMGPRLKFTFLGFGSGSARRGFKMSNLSVLAEAAKTGGCVEAVARDAGSSSTELSTTFSSVSASTKVHRSSLALGQSMMEQRRLPIDRAPLSEQLQRFKLPDREFFEIVSVSSHRVQRVKFVKEFEGGDQFVRDTRRRLVPQALPFLDPAADGLAIRRIPFAKGGERYAFVAREVKNSADPQRCQFVGEWLVAKQTRVAQSNPRGFHIKYVQLQQKASFLAKKFNQRLKWLEISQGISLPHVEFIDSFVYAWQKQASSSGDQTRGDVTGLSSAGPDEHVVLWSSAETECLVEPVLSAELKFEKFNNNAGHVCETAARADRGDAEVERMLAPDSQSQHPEGSMAPSTGGLAGLGQPVGQAPGLGAIEEGDEDEEEEEEERGGGGGGAQDAADQKLWEDGEKYRWGRYLQSLQADPRGGLRLRLLPPGEVAQSYSHYSFEFSKRELVVVDLQGKVERRGAEGRQVIRLTDPAIHTHTCRDLAASHPANRLRWGITDKGERGVRDFFRSHKCNELCHVLGIKRGM
uniref:Alpha-type protein kinase domain-containing protein n=1 Tax=Chromera velia CCMP2878 TaxID=1169474 RepID=A0A0G4IDI3_9ALVE|eukprot:Cvel_13437.t1-p1 / transcript=Cvel_13437.t1 / gene=Cvel_13437 / organism=Chromera_velia_CCMP2878 / gene_product=Alpha-protein kinase vwkA, putative / transcript_product=Alpha-protein kinase vwkA, putative / location=Cvel_scaffold917:31462-33846(+) / protein_length=795 / sequence_SO=supercontig / SO=protein_coding / is_pseudo=false